MYCGVMYLNEETQTYSGRHYTYKTDLDVKPFDRVIAPVGAKAEPKRAVVVEVDIAEDEIPEHIIPIIKEIKERDA